MTFGGWQKTSLLDYPRKISTVLFTIGCPYRCRFCYNPELVIPPFAKSIPEKEIFDYLKKRQNILEAVVLTGGEPLMHNDLLEFIKKIKKLNFLVKLDTNGFYPFKLKEAIKSGMIDYIAMDIKSSLREYDNLTQIKGSGDEIPKSIALIINSSIPYEFRSTIVEGVHDQEEILKMAKLITGAHKYYLQQFKGTGKLIDPAFKDKNSLSKKELKEIAKTCKKYVKKCIVR